MFGDSCRCRSRTYKGADSKSGYKCRYCDPAMGSPRACDLGSTINESPRIRTLTVSLWRRTDSRCL